MEFIEKKNLKELKPFFEKILQYGLEYKNRPNVLPLSRRKITEWTTPDAPPEKGISLDLLVESLIDVAKASSNLGSENFLGFPDAGSSVAANLAGVLSLFLNQNLVNESFCAPEATFVELDTILWLRQLAGYILPRTINAAEDAGGVAVTGGVQSNAIGLLAARERLVPGALQLGLTNVDISKIRIITPGDINHYSIRCSLGWLGLGEKSIIQSPLGEDFKYDLPALEEIIKKELSLGNKIMALVAYAGDSRTQSIDCLDELGTICEKYGIWFHVDACHGVQLLFSKRLKKRMRGIEKADSIAVDPHKVLWIPYNLSYILFKDPRLLKKIGASSDLITKERWAFGQFTPFTGSKAFNSFKLWALIKHLGTVRIGELIEGRIDLVENIQKLIDNNGELLRINNTDINSVAFVYLPPSYRAQGRLYLSDFEIDQLNEVNLAIYRNLLKEGNIYIHTFVLKDYPRLFHPERRHSIQMLRIMPGNHSVDIDIVKQAVEKVVKLGSNYCKLMQASRIRKNGTHSHRSDILATLNQNIQSCIPTNKYFTVVYGSSAYKENPFRSDVDLVTIVDDKSYSKQCKKELIQIIQEVHQRYDLNFDEEVPFENKVLMSYSEAEKAVLGGGLDIVKGRVVIPAIIKDKAFLSSKSMRLRLVHNAVTTSGFVLCGDEGKYQYFRRKGLMSLIWILIHQLPHGGFQFEDLLKVLYSNGTREGEDYLGYKKIPFGTEKIEKPIKDAFSCLVQENKLFHVVGGYHLSQEFDLDCLKRLVSIL